MAEIVLDNTTEEQVGSREAGSPNSVVPVGTLLTERVAQLFDLKPSEVSKYTSKLNTLIDYAKVKTEDHSVSGLKWAIKSLGTKLGTPPLGNLGFRHRKTIK